MKQFRGDNERTNDKNRKIHTMKYVEGETTEIESRWRETKGKMRKQKQSQQKPE